MPRPLRIRLGTLVETTEMPTLRPYFTAAGLCFLPGIALAAGGGGDVAHTLEDSLVPMAFHALNLLLLLGGLGYLLKGRITTALATRADTIAHAIQGAGAAEAEAEAKAEAESEAKAKAKANYQAKATAEAKAEPKTLADAEAKAQAEPEAKAEAEAEAKTLAEPKLKL